MGTLSVEAFGSVEALGALSVEAFGSVEALGALSYLECVSKLMDSLTIPDRGTSDQM